MDKELQRVCYQTVAVVLAVAMSGCAAQAPAVQSNASPGDSRAILACTLASQCVNSFDSGGLGPMRYVGTPAQALAVLQATLAEFPEAQIVKTDGLYLEVVFTTALGFRDLVDFRIDAQAQRIDFRSRSSIGLFDFGKNRSRMSAFSARFEQNTKR